MSKLTDALNNNGCNMKTTMQRFLDDESFYQRCLQEMLADKAFEELGNNLTTHNIEEAFNQAHLLKGVIANLGITPMVDIVEAIVETLRAGKDDGLLTRYELLMKERDNFQSILKENS